MSVAAGSVLGRRELIVIALLWAAMAGAYAYANWSEIVALTLPDADDYLRLQQVRDWLAGQGWFDVAQHRVNPPVGGALHWSRIVDLPIAGAIALLTPLVGQANAEMITAAALPLAVMALAMFIAGATAARLVGRAWAPVAAMAIPLSAIAYPQLMPLRIDHHGWQLVLALTLLWALTDEAHKRRSGAIAGAAAALWLNISIEGLPIVTCAALILGVRWLCDPRELTRLQFYVSTLTLGSALFETATMPSAWLVAECDRISQPYLLTFAVASLAAAGAGMKALERGWRLRLLFASVAGAAAATVFASAGPACLAGPFGDLDPLTRQLWLDRIGESMPLIDRGIGAFIADAGFSVLGAAGAGLAIRGARGETRLAWISALALIVASAVLMLVVSRTGAVAHGFAALGAAFLGLTLFQRARAMSLMPARVLATVLAIAVATPAPLLPAFKLNQYPPRARVCAGAIQSLSALPPSVLYAPLDIGPRLIVRTPHSVIATGHHRNHAAMTDVIATFTGSTATARALIAAHGADYVVLCTAAPEIRNYLAVAPDGFAARLISGRAPAWLRPLDIAPADAGLLVFAVDPAAHNDELRGRLTVTSPLTPAFQFGVSPNQRPTFEHTSA